MRRKRRRREMRGRRRRRRGQCLQKGVEGVIEGGSQQMQIR
jgi:hypothetical protein